MDRDSHHRMPNDPYRPAMWSENWRDGGAIENAQTPPQPPVEPTEFQAQTTPFPPYYDQLSGGCNMGAAASHFDITNIPKYWNPPLTCFYWHTYGYCNKTDADCLYAHYNTGVVASAPFATVEGQVGRNTMKHFNEHRIKHKELEDREARLVVREKELGDKAAWLAAREKEIRGRIMFHKATQASEQVIRGIYEIIDDTKTSLTEALDTLNSRNDKPKTETMVFIADHAAGDIANAIVRLQRVEDQAETGFGRPAPLPARVSFTFEAVES